MTTWWSLKLARSYIEKEENWTQGAAARDAKMRACKPQSRWAERFSVKGAIQVITSDCQPIECLEAQVGNLDDFNDNHTHAEVLDAFDKVIAALETVRRRRET